MVRRNRPAHGNRLKASGMKVPTSFRSLVQIRKQLYGDLLTKKFDSASILLIENMSAADV